MALALVRLAALTSGWYLAVCTLALVFTRPFGRSRVAAAAARATPAVVRRVVSGGGGLGLAAGAVLGVLPSANAAFTGLAPRPAAEASGVRAPQDPGPPTATMTRSARDTPTAAMARSPSDDTENPPTAVMARLPAEGASPTPRAPPAPATADAAQAATPPSSWTVEAGDSFWSIAAETVASAGGEPNDRRVTAYWRRLVEANRGRLIDAGNPDLLVPGQHLVLPDEDG
jgi:nucleoid-associated protein YgaU